MATFIPAFRAHAFPLFGVEGKHADQSLCALRIADQAKGGVILVSALRKELSDSAGHIGFGEGQEVELKGLAGLNRVYSINCDLSGKKHQLHWRRSINALIHVRFPARR